MDMSTPAALIAFLNARLDEDEAAAKAAWGVEWDWRYVTRPFGERPSIAHTVHIARHDPDRTLRYVEAGRKLIAEYEGVTAITGDDDQYATGVWTGLRALAARFSDHPDFQQEWKL